MNCFHTKPVSAWKYVTGKIVEVLQQHFTAACFYDRCFYIFMYEKRNRTGISRSCVGFICSGCTLYPAKPC